MANAIANDVQDKSLVYCTDILEDKQSYSLLLAKGPYDMVFANIVPDIIAAMLPFLSKAVKPDGYLICSGIIKEREKETADNMRKYGFSSIECNELNGWVALTGRKDA